MHFESRTQSLLDAMAAGVLLTAAAPVKAAAAALAGGGVEVWCAEPQCSPDCASLPPGPPEEDSPVHGPVGSGCPAASVDSLLPQPLTGFRVEAASVYSLPPQPLTAMEELVDLQDLADLAELADDVAVAALHRAKSSESLVPAPGWEQCAAAGSAPSRSVLALSRKEQLMCVATVQQGICFPTHNPSAQPGQVACEMVAAQQPAPGSGSTCASVISEATLVLAEAQRLVTQHVVKVPLWQAAPQLGSCASPGRSWWLWAACTPRGRKPPRGEASPPDAQALPRGCLS